MSIYINSKEFLPTLEEAFRRVKTDKLESVQEIASKRTFEEIKQRSILNYAAQTMLNLSLSNKATV